MTDRPQERPDAGAQASDEAEAARRRRRAEVFGDVLPESTRDDRDPETTSEQGSGEAWLRANVPPHHG